MLSPIEIMKIEYEKLNSGVRTIPISYKKREIERRSQQFENSSRPRNMQKNVRMGSAVNAYTKVLSRSNEYSRKS